MDGILIVDKPKGMTSHDVVDRVRKQFKLKKVGHAGTLDPMATGVLVLLIGAYTRSSNLFINDNKEYEATLMLGATSDTGDAEGKVINSAGKADFSEREIRKVFDSFLGEIEQTPPMYSAVKVKGKKLYELARKGISVQVKPRKIMIKELEITSIRLPEISFRVVCSKGTYIRQLCVDIGKCLGCGAYLSCLRRTKSGTFVISDAVGMGDVESSEAPAFEKRLRQP